MKITYNPALHLRPYQEQGVKFLMERNRALLLDAPGIGKTAQAIVAAESKGARSVLVICPPVVKYYWESEFKKWTVRKHNIQVVDGMKCWLDELADIVICPYSLLHSPMVFDQLKERRWSVMIIDEVHFCKAYDAERTKMVLGRGGLIESSILVWGLSGTLMTNTPIDLFTIMRSIGQEHIGKYKTWFTFTRRYCARFKDKFGRWNVSGASNLPELRQRIFQTGLALRREKKEVLSELPRRSYRIVPVAGAIDSDLEHQVQFDANGVKTDKNTVALRRAVLDAKLPFVREYLSMLDDGNEKIVVFTWHRDMTEGLHDHLKNSVMYYGGMSHKQKEYSLQQFIKKGGAKFFIANICSAGTGLDGLQRVSSHCVFAEIPWTYVELAQTTDRLWRMGQEHHVSADILLLKDSFEMKMLKGVRKKRETFHSIFSEGT